MLISCSLIFFLAASQEISIQVDYNDQATSINRGDLTVGKLKSIFNYPS